MTRPNGPRTRFEGSAPILRVANMSASLRYYVEVLRFQNADWGFSAIPLLQFAGPWNAWCHTFATPCTLARLANRFGLVCARWSR
jgi:hypothetical protein